MIIFYLLKCIRDLQETWYSILCVLWIYNHFSTTSVGSTLEMQCFPCETHTSLLLRRAGVVQAFEEWGVHVLHGWTDQLIRSRCRLCMRWQIYAGNPLVGHWSCYGRQMEQMPNHIAWLDIVVTWGCAENSFPFITSSDAYKIVCCVIPILWILCQFLSCFNA